MKILNLSSEKFFFLLSVKLNTAEYHDTFFLLLRHFCLSLRKIAIYFHYSLHRSLSFTRVILLWQLTLLKGELIKIEFLLALVRLNTIFLSYFSCLLFYISLCQFFVCLVLFLRKDTEGKRREENFMSKRFLLFFFILSLQSYSSFLDSCYIPFHTLTQLVFVCFYFPRLDRDESFCLFLFRN